MKLWILRPVEDLKNSDNPWEPWYDKCFGFVIRAETEQDARLIANRNAGDENRGTFLNKKIADTKTPWIDPKYTTCKELSNEGDPGVIIRDDWSA